MKYTGNRSFKRKNRITSHRLYLLKYIVILEDDGVYRPYESMYYRYAQGGENWPKQIEIIFQSMLIKKAVHESRRLNGQPENGEKI
jgi:hypothetical protein